MSSDRTIELSKLERNFRDHLIQLPHLQMRKLGPEIKWASQVWSSRASSGGWFRNKANSLCIPSSIELHWCSPTGLCTYFWAVDIQIFRVPHELIVLTWEIRWRKWEPKVWRNFSHENSGVWAWVGKGKETSRCHQIIFLNSEQYLSQATSLKRCFTLGMWIKSIPFGYFFFSCIEGVTIVYREQQWQAASLYLSCLDFFKDFFFKQGICFKSYLVLKYASAFLTCHHNFATHEFCELSLPWQCCRPGGKVIGDKSGKAFVA